MRGVMILFLLLFSLSMEDSFSQTTKKSLEAKRIEVGLKKAQTPEILDEEKKKLFQMAPLKTIPLKTTIFRVSLNERYLAFSTKDGKVIVYDLRKGEILIEKKVSEKPVYCVTLHPFKNIIAYGGREGIIYIFDIEKRKEIHTIFELEAPVSETKFSSDGTVLGVAHLGEGELTFYDAEKFEKLMNIKPHHGGIYYISFSPDSELVATASRDKRISIIPLGEEKPSQTLTKHTFLVLCVEFSPDNKFLASGDADARLFLWERDKNKIKKEPCFNWIHGDWVTSLKFYKDYLFTTSKDGKVRIFDFINKSLLGIFKATDSPAFTLDIDPKGKFLAIGSKKDGVKIYELEKILEKIK